MLGFYVFLSLSSLFWDLSRRFFSLHNAGMSPVVCIPIQLSQILLKSPLNPQSMVFLYDCYSIGPIVFPSPCSPSPIVLLTH